MAQANPFDQFDSQQAPVPVAQIRPIIAAPRDPNEAAQEARAETGTQLNVQGEERAGRKEQFDYAKELRTEFRKAPETTNYETVVRQFSSALGAKPTPTGDQALITAYAKMLDPASVVRTEEFNIVQAGDSAIGRQVARIQRELGIDSSGLLRPEVRNRVLTEMRNLVDNYRSSYDRVRSDYEGLAGSYGIKPDLVLGSRIDDPYLPKIEKAWKERGVPEAGTQQLGLEAGATFSTEQDKAIRDATQQAWQSGADLQGIVAAAQAAGGNITPNDLANIQAAIEARAKGQSVTFNPAQTGQRSPIAQAAGELLMTPAGTALTGAANAASVGLLSQFAGDQVQGLEALNPNAALVGELAGSIAGTAGLARGGAAALRMAAPGIAERVAGGGLAGAIGREALTEGAYGGLYAANTGEDIGTGIGLGAAGSLGGRALGAAARRVAPAVGRMLGREGGNIPPDGGAGGGVPPAGGMPPMGGAPSGGETYTVFRGTNPSGPNDFGVAGKGEYGSGRLQNAQAYAGQNGNIVEQTVTLQNPLKVTYDELNAIQTDLFGKPLTGFEKDQSAQFDAWMRSKGYDGAVIFDPEISTTVPEEVVKLAPTQGVQAEEPFAPITFRSNDAGSAGTPLDLIRATQAADLGIDLMPFQRTRKFQDMQRAHELAKNGEVGLPIRRRFSEQQAAIAQKFDDYIESTGSEVREDITAQGAKITDAMTNMLDRDKARVRVLYTRAGKSDEAGTVVPIDRNIDVAIDGEDANTNVIDWLNFQTTGLQTSGVTDSAKQLAVKLGLATKDKTTGDLIPQQATIANLEKWRREINQISDANDPSLQRQKSILKTLIDAHTEPYAKGAFAEARAARREVGRKYEDVTTIAQLLKTKRNTPERVVASEKVVERILQGGTSVANVKALRDLVIGPGGDPQAWKEVQGATLEFLRDKAYQRGSHLDEFGNRTMNVGAFRNAVRELDKSGKLNVLLGYEKANAVRTMSDAAETIFTAPPGSVNFSNTSSGWWNIADMILNTGLFQMPLPAGFLSNAVKPLKSYVKDRPLRQEVSRLVGGSEQ